MKLLNKRLVSFLLAVVMLLGMMPMTVFATESEHTHTYENSICTGCGATVSPYLQQLPEDIIGCTNLYDSLVPVKGYYTATKYDTSNGDVLSVVIPVEPGDQIAASSFGPVSENMGSVNGIRVTYLLGDEIVTSLSPSEVYSGYISDGYITVPDGVDAICVPWWKPSDSNWLTLSQVSKDFTVHSPKTVSAQAPTCTERGYTAGEICEVCNASLDEREEIPPTGHTYNGDTCTVCGAVNIEAILGGKYVSILGDSISTFNGYSNDATVNTTIGGNGPRYDAGTADTKPGSYCLLESVDQTWWMHFANRSGMKLLVNNSWAGSQVFGGQTSDGRVIPAAYLDRCVNLHDNTLENNPGNAPINPDVIFVYLGINDYNFNRSNVGTGTVDYAGLVSSDGTYTTPATFGEAYGIMLHKMCNTYPDAQIFAMTLLPENLYSVDKAVWEQHNAYIRAAAEYYDIPVVDLAEKCAITWENYSGYMIDKIHPTTAGMELISDCIEAELVSYYKENPPHTHTYEAAVTPPACTEQGYTTYSCECGDSYRTPWLDETAYEGMTIACIGDSITAAVGVTKDENDYVKLLAEQLEMDYIRLGASGTTLCTDGSRTCNISRLTEAYLDGADVVTIAMGINDFCAAGAGYYELGDINSTDSSTIYGAARMWCERIAELRKTDSLKDTQFYFVTPVICSWNNSVTSARNWDQSKTNIHGYTLRDLCNAIIEVAKQYDVAVIDLNLLSGMYYVDAEDNNTAVFGGDGVHPGATGHAMMANAMANVLLQNDLRDDHTHTFGSWITTTWPSCFAGEQQRVCTICSATESRVTESDVYHSYSPTVSAPTCTEQGYTTYTCTLCGDSYVDDYVNANDHTYENGICTGCGVKEWDTDGDDVLEILAIGNSFSVDALQYAYQIAHNLGIAEIAIGNLYIGGCTLETHAANAAGDLGKYTYYFNDNGTWTSTGSYKISTAIESRSWDYISLQQGSPVSGVESSYNEDLTDLIAYVHARSDAKLVWHMTWAYQQNSTHSAFPTYNKDQMTMYNGIVSAVQNKIVTNGDIDLIVPNGTAVQNSRTSLLGDTTTRDGYHMSYDYGRYLTGLLFVKTVTGLPVDDVTYAPSGVDAEEQAIAIESANNAAAKPFEVTQSAFVKVEPEIPDEGYVLLKPELHKGAYWHSINADHYNTLVTDASNSKYFFATIRFTRETLPVGSIIVLENGWQYRPEGWITDTVQSNRVDTTTESYVVVTEEWWSDYIFRGFNISKVGTPSLMSLNAEDIHKVFHIYVPEEKHIHTYSNGICTGCGEIVVDGIWQIMEDGVVIGAYSDLQCAVDACKDDSTIVLTEGYAATTGASIDKNITIDGDNHLVDISGCSDAFITVVEGAEVTVRNLRMDSGANGFAVDYDAVTYTDYTIPLVSGSLDSDPKVSKSAIISSGSLICENVEISNRYTASVGGAMQILAGTATLTNCDFTHNYGTSKGGALFIGSNFGTRTEYPVELVTITGCTFTENYTGHGGAIYAYNVVAIELTDSEFLNNTANGGKGGAIDLFSETTKPTTAMSLGLDFIQTSICNCTFRGNWAGNDGFAIQSYDSDLYIYDSEFIENVGVHPTSSVGTVSIEAYRHADENYRIYTQMDGCLFESNQGPCAVYGDHSSISDLDVTDCVFQYNKGNTSFLLYSATSRISNCQFIGEVMVNGVIDARIYENYTIPPLLTLADITFTGCDTPAEILTRKQGHNAELNTYRVILEGTTNGNITIWDSNTVTVNGTHTGNVQLGYGSERACLTVGSSGTVNGIIFAQPVDSKAKLGERYMVEVKAEGEGLKYQWYFRNAGSSKWNKSSVKDNTYDDVMTTARAGREVYCVITDANGNSVKTDTVKLVFLPSEELEITQQPTDDQVYFGEHFCATVEAKGEKLKYQWYFRNAGSDKWYKSSVKDNTYDDVMTKARAGREIYCVITDAYGNSVTTETVKLICIPTELEIISQPTSAEVSFGEMFCATVEAKGDGLKYQWYFRNSGTDKWYKSGVRDNTYDDVMTKARNHREIYCVITDMWGNSVTTDTVKLTAVPSVELKVLSQSYESAVMGERYCVTVEAQGDGLNYQWYFRNAGASRWSKSGVRDNTYDDVMNKTRANREVYCVISDACGNQITTEVITLTVEQ